MFRLSNLLMWAALGFVGVLGHALSTASASDETLVLSKQLTTSRSVSDMGPLQKLLTPTTMSVYEEAEGSDPVAETRYRRHESRDGLDDINDELDLADVILDKILVMGKKIWAVIEKNKPVVNVGRERADLLPEGASSWLQLENWDLPKAKTYRVAYQNAYGITVVDFKFKLLFTPGGAVKGFGQYLSNVTVVPSKLLVRWGYTFSMNASVPNAANAGTHEDPMAQGEVLVEWKIDTVMNHLEETMSYYVRGDGSVGLIDDGGEGR